MLLHVRLSRMQVMQDVVEQGVAGSEDGTQLAPGLALRNGLRVFCLFESQARSIDSKKRLCANLEYIFVASRISDLY